MLQHQAFPNGQDATPPAAAVHQPLKRRHVLAAVIGNGLEFYDFVTYAFFAIQIGHAFFPSQNAFASLMLSAGHLWRRIPDPADRRHRHRRLRDRVGRRAAMMLSFTLMGCAIVAMALIPPYAVIGVAAPILAVVARMVQGFSLGGEVGPNTAYLLESAAPHRRGLMVAWQGASQNISSVTGGLVGLGLSMVLSHAALDAYGWRIAFLLGAVTLPFGLLLRRTMPETLHAPETHAAAPANVRKGLGSLRDNGRIIGLGLLVLGGGTISTYVTNYMTTYAQSTLHMPAGLSFAASLVPNAVGVVGILFGGWLSDRIGRRPVMIWPSLAHLMLVLPVFYWIVSARSALALLGGMAMLAFVGSIGNGAFYPALCETLPKAVRGRGFATVYAVAIAVFGGTTQLVVTWLLHVTGNAMAPGWYLLAAKVIAFSAVRLILEKRPRSSGAAGWPSSRPSRSHSVEPPSWAS